MRILLTAGKIPARKRVMKLVCSWCRRIVRNGHAPTSHVLCTDCELQWDT